MKNTLPALLTLLALTFCFRCYGQHNPKKIKLIYAKWDSTIKAPVVPDNIFSSHAGGLVMSPRQSKVKDQPKYYLDISWEAPSIDGHFILTVTKKQVILTSGHENPNPNYLFWFTNIDEHTYEQIVRNVEEAKKSFDEQYLEYFYGRQIEFKYFVPGRKQWSDSDRENKMCINAKKLIALFNKGLKRDERIVFPNRKELEHIKPVMTASMASEITEWFPK